MKKAVSLLLALVLILSLAACAPSEQENDSEASTSEATQSSSNGEATQSSTDDKSNVTEADKEIVVGISADPESWSPWERFNNGRRDTMPMVYQTLTSDVINPETGKYETYYVMITGYEKVDDSTYEIYVREGIVDTAGNAFKASDAVYTFETAKAMGILSQLNAIDHLELVDDYTFRLIAGRTLAVGDFEDLLSAINMVTQASYEASEDGFATNPIGTTGYELSEYTAGSRAVFTKASSYWNEAANESESVEDGYCYVWDTKNLDKVQFEIITDTSTMAVALETGQIDLSTTVATDDLVLFQEGGQNADKFTAFTYPDNMYALSFNADSASDCENYNLRMAIALAVDSAGVLDVAYNGDGLISKAWAYPTFVDYQADWDSQSYFDYDEEKAAEYLQAYYDETGTTASDVSLKILIMNRPSMQKAAEAVQAYIVNLVGNQNCVEIISYDQSTYEEMYLDPNEFDLMISYIQTNRTYATYAWNNLANKAKTTNGSTIFFDDSDEMLDILRAAISEETHSDATVSAFQDYINENAYMKALICGNVYVVAANWVESLQMGPKNCVALCGLEYDWAAKASW